MGVTLTLIRITVVVGGWLVPRSAEAAVASETRDREMI